MSDVIVVAAIAAGPAFITGLATLWVTHRRDGWERARLAALDAHERARAQAEVAEAAEGRRRQLYGECLRTVGSFLEPGVGLQNWSDADRQAHSRMVTAWTEARTVADPRTAATLTAMLLEHTRPRIYYFPLEAAMEKALEHREALVLVLSER